MHLHHSYKKSKKALIHILSFFGVGCFLLFNNVQGYYFGLKSADDTPENIEKIESTLDVKLPVVSFIFDPRDDCDVLNSIDKIVEKLGTDRIYHFTISPDNYSAEEVALGKFDEQYTAFFKKIKEKNLHVIFRTMHEMNGGWYAWSSNPEKFKAAWIHVRILSRVVGLSEENIAFDFSVNHWDMPTKGTPSQSAKLIECTVNKKGCYHFEDYYPGDEFVDVIGFTFYNRGKAVGNRKWLTPIQILYDKNWKTYTRLKKFKKPIVIDEVATTSVWYDGDYDYDKSRDEYITQDARKDGWLHQLWEFLLNHNEIIAAVYFNTDYTYGLLFNVMGEADWAIVNMDNGRVYGGFQELEMFGEKNLDNILTTLFHLKKVSVDSNDIFISPQCEKDFLEFLSLINSKSQSVDERIKLVKKLQGVDFGSQCTTKSLAALMELYTKG